MIMDAKLTGRQSRMLRLAAGTLVLGWGGFVLSGAAASNGAAKPAEDVSAKPAVMVVEAIAGPGEEDVMVFTPGLIAGAAMGDVQMLVEGGEAGGLATQHVAIAVQAGPSEEELAAFLAAHPTADADGDGALSRSEHQAYIVALAVNTPQPVIGRFPKSDVDGDGALSPNEAARLVAGGGFPHFASPLKAGRFVVRSNAAQGDAGASGEITVAVECEDGDAAPGAKVIKVRHSGVADGTAEPKVRVIRRTKDADGNVTESEETADVAMAPHAIAVAGVPAAGGMLARAMPFPPPSLPARWIAENVSGSPSAAQVASYVKLVEEAPLALFLEHNPEADANKDGKLTVEERDAHLKGQMSRMHQKLLERHPEADANGDGVLTPEEAREFFHGKARGMVPAMGAIKASAAPGEEIHVEVISEDPPK